jgi:hypothetical protein
MFLYAFQTCFITSSLEISRYPGASKSTRIEFFVPFWHWPCILRVAWREHQMTGFG